jgi:signal transduction histidine kinase
VVIAPLAAGLDALGSSALVQPLLVRGVPIGLLVVRAAEGRATFSPADVELGQTVAGLLSSAIENGRLFQRTMAEAAQEERRRLARDLHDSITQSLYSTVLLARAWSRLASSASPDELSDWFGQVEGIALQALREMRLLIYQLRSQELDELGLAEALRQRLEAVEGRTGVAVRLEAEGYSQTLPSEIESQLFAIIQEALNNALRHAEATTITVTLQSDRAGVRVEVCDNGRGFDQDAHSAGMGLTTMRERAEGIGGFFSLSTEPGAGTTVSVRMPPPAPTHGKAPARALAATRRQRR